MIYRIYRDPAHREGSQRFLNALLREGNLDGRDVANLKSYKPFDGVLISYGSGRPDLKKMIQSHPGRVVHVDVGYWGKCFRLALDGLHQTILPEAPPERFDSQGFTLTNDYDPNGHILLIGMGPKSRHEDATFEERALARIRACTDREVIYRPKPKRPHPKLPVKTDGSTPIEELLKGASLVVTRHSNVGVDACFQGIPVCTETGAASALYGNDLSNPVIPTEEQRRDFLRRLAWWNWSESEGTALWRWIEHALSVIPFRTGS